MSESKDEQSGGKHGRLPKPSTFRQFKIFVDGSATDQAKTVKKKHLRRAGIGIFHPASGTMIAEPFPLPNPTNNRAEYWACIRALEWVLEQTKHLELKQQAQIEVVLYCDSMLLINSMTKWVDGWKRRGWKKADGQPVLNLELVQKLDQLIKNRLKVRFIKVKAHKPKPPKSKGKEVYWEWKGNFEADRLANEGRKIAEQG
jgi:ribonuclease HI